MDDLLYATLRITIFDMVEISYLLILANYDQPELFLTATKLSVF